MTMIVGFKRQERSYAGDIWPQRRGGVLQKKSYPVRQIGFLGLLHLLCWACLVLTTWDCTVFPLTSIAFTFALMTSFIVTGLISMASAYFKIHHLVKAALISSAISTIFASFQVTAVFFAPLTCSQWMECGLPQSFVSLVMLATSTVLFALLSNFLKSSKPKAIILSATAANSYLDSPPAYHEVVGGKQIFWIELFQKVPPNIHISR